MSQNSLPSVSDVNSAKGDDLRALYKQVFGEKTTSKDSGVLRGKIISHLKTLAKAPAKNKPANGKDVNSAAYDSSLRAAEEAEKKGEWLTAAMALESAAKLTVGTSCEQLLERAAKARINAKAPPLKSDKSAATSERKAQIAAKAAEAKAAREAKAAEAKTAREAKAAEGKAAKVAKAAERETAREAKKAEREAAKVKEYTHDPRVAHLVGKTIVHDTRGGEHYEIEVLPTGFRYEGAEYKSLSAVGKHVTGKSTNGFVFFGLVAAPRPELKDEEAITTAYTEARKGCGADVPQSLEKVLAGGTEEAHEALASIEAAAEALAVRAKALRTACRLIEAKKGRAA